MTITFRSEALSCLCFEWISNKVTDFNDCCYTESWEEIWHKFVHTRKVSNLVHGRAYTKSGLSLKPLLPSSNSSLHISTMLIRNKNQVKLFIGKLEIGRSDLCTKACVGASFLWLTFHAWVGWFYCRRQLLFARVISYGPVSVCQSVTRRSSSETGGADFWLSAFLRLKKVKVAHTRLPSVGFRSWSRFLAVSLQVTWIIIPAVGCHYFPSGLQLPPQRLRGLLPVLLLGKQGHNGCEQFA